jgi:hypothetical protein
MRPSPAVAHVAAILGLALGVPAAVRRQETFVLVVRPADARLEIRVPQQQWWGWNLATTPDNVMEYEWAVELPVDSTTCALGFTLFKPPGAQPGRGPLAALLKAGQVDVWLRGPQGAVRADVAVRAEARNGIVTLDVLGGAAVRRLFGDHPETATAMWRVPGAPEARRRIRITYADQDARGT